MKWQYKVIPLAELISSSQEYGVVLSQKEVDEQRERSKEELQILLNKLGSEEWDFAAVIGEFAIFKKAVG